MKRFIISALCVSVFFIGLGSIVEKTSAKFNSDERALELIRGARVAIGGEANINDVKSMTIVASTTNFFEKNGVQDVKQGSLEINMKLPGQFSKNINIGNGDGTKMIELDSGSEMVFMKKDGETVDFKSEDGVKKKGVFVFKKGDGADVEFKSEDGTVKENVFIIKKGDGDTEWTSDAEGNVKIDDEKIIITKDDGTTEEIKLEGKNNIHLKKEGDGNFITEDGKTHKVIVRKDKDGKVLTENIVGPSKFNFAREGGHNGDMIRTTFALLLKAPEGSNTSYKYLGQGNVDGNSSNIVEVSSNGSSFKLYLDASTNLPQMVSYQAQQNMFFFNKGDAKNMSDNVLIEMKKDSAKSVEHQIKFSDFRSVANLLLPHSWTKSIGGKPSENTNVTSFEINPANIDDKFKHKNVYFQKK